jgi:hypothetical protein
MNLPLVVLSAIAFVGSGIGFSAPNFVAVTSTTSGVTSKFTIGTAILETAASSQVYTTGYTWCTTATTTYCSSFSTVHLVTLVLYGVGVLAAIGGIVSAVVTPKGSLAPMWLMSLSWLTQAAGIFTFFFRTIPLFQAHLYANGATSATWDFDWASYCALGGAVFTIATVVAAGAMASAPTVADEGEAKKIS